MKRLSQALALLFAVFAAPALAETDPVFDENDNAVTVTEDYSDTDATLAKDGNKSMYNIWVCTAIRRGYVGFSPNMHFGATTTWAKRQTSRAANADAARFDGV